MLIFGWFGVKFVPTGETYFLAMLNSGIHIAMYFYYMMAAMGPQFQKYLWWKRYLTQMQLIQFCMIMGHYCYAIFRPCDFPREVLIAYTVNSVSFLVLFLHFYRLSYNKKPQQTNEQNKTPLKNGHSSNPMGTPDLLMSNSPRKQD